MGGSETIT